MRANHTSGIGCFLGPISHSLIISSCSCLLTKSSKLLGIVLPLTPPLPLQQTTSPPFSRELIFHNHTVVNILFFGETNGLPPFVVPVVMRAFRMYSPCLEQGGAERSLTQDTSPRMLPGACSPGYCADDNDHNPSVSDAKYISIHQYTKTILC